MGCVLSKIYFFTGLNIEFTYMQSRNGSPFRDVGIPTRKRGLLGNKITARGNQLFITATDTIFQYDINGHIVKAHILSSATFETIAVKSQVGKFELVQFLHNFPNKGEQKSAKSLYVLEEGSNEFIPITLLGLNDAEPLIVDKVGDFY